MYIMFNLGEGEGAPLQQVQNLQSPTTSASLTEFLCVLNVQTLNIVHWTQTLNKENRLI